ncbi:MAG TPA: hypothetical protein VLA41_10755 [Burkholderiales bacterium]|nr:hypothetical protein [Burkholderiales bacterium]
MGWKVNTFAGVALVAAAAALLLPRVPGHYLASDDEVKRAVRALHDATAELRRTVGIELLTVKRIAPDLSERQHPSYGAYQVRVNESGTIVARSLKYDVVLVFRPLPGGEKVVPWRCRVSPGAFVIEGCEPGGGG